MNSARLSIVLAVLLLALTGHGWVARYNGPAGEPDCATAIAADPAGNLYVTGSSISASGGPDFLTIKYNPFGDTLWVRRLSSAGSAADRAAAVAYASYGSAYVAGFVTVGGNTDFLTVRYRAGTGDTAWTRRYGSTGEDFAIALVADDRGSVFVGGTARFGIRSNAAVVCYDSTGVQRWATRIPARTGDSASAVTALAAAPDRGVYACGWMRAGSTVTDYFVARLRPTGETAWVRTYSGAPAGYDSAYGLAADARGNVYVTGGSMNPTLDYDYATVKYDSLGTQLWVGRYNALPDSLDDVACAIGVDSLGNVYVTGYSVGAGSRYDDYATVSYSAAGVERWVMRYHGGSGDDEARAIGLDHVGGVYVTGVSETNNNGTDIYTIKYDTAGVQRWTARYNYTPPNRDDGGVGLAVCGPGVVGVTGTSYNPSSDTDYVTIRYVERDLGVVAILRPTDTLPPLPVAPEVRIRNEGMQTETVTVYVEIHEGGRPAYAAAVTVYGIGAGATQDVLFPAFVDREAQYTITCRVNRYGDLNPANDTLTGWFVLKWRELPFWLKMADVPPGLDMKAVKDGGALCHGRYTADDLAVFALKGNNTNEFYRYHVAVDSWYSIKEVPIAVEKRKMVKKGAALCYDRYDTLIFALKGNNTREFWRYDVIHDTWGRVRDIPYGAGPSFKAVKGGAALAFYHQGATDEDWVYALKGNKTFEFWRYSVQGDSWQARRDVPMGTKGKGMGDGSCLVNAGGTLYALKGAYNELYSYDIGLDSWYARTPMPLEGRSGKSKKAKYGTGMCYSSDIIYAIKGGTCEFWGYGVDGDVWFELESMPRLPSGRPVKGGGALTFGSGLVWALKGNKTFEFYSYDRGADDDARPDHVPGRVQSPLAGGPTRAVSLTPNPLRRGTATLLLPGAAWAQWHGEIEVSIHDVAGRMVWHRSCYAKSASVPLDLRNLRSGVYVVRVQTDRFSTARKLAIKR